VRAAAAALALATCLAASGCGSGVQPGVKARTGTAAASSTSTPATTAAATGTATATTTTPTTTAAATTTTVLPGTGRPKIAIGDKNFSEQFILGELYDLALSAQGFNVTLSANIGTSAVTLQALKDGTLDMYPEYLNVWDTSVADDAGTFASLQGAYDAGQRFAQGRGLELLSPTPFSDTSGIGVTTAFAKQYHLRSLFGLQRVASSLVLGAPIEFSQSPSGLPAIEQAYGFRPAKVEPLDIGAQYRALTAGTVEAAYVNSSDAQLSFPAFTLLHDPQRVLGYGNVVPVVRESVLEAEGPAFAATIEDVDALLTQSAMRELNAEVDIAHVSPTSAARLFLQQHGLVPPG
jgi:osmoprotectant transport system substrate-binding protein